MANTRRRTIDQSAGGKLHDRNAEESWALLEDLALYDNESWNDPRDFAKLVKAISLPQDVSSTSDRRLIELENQVQRLMEAHLALTISKRRLRINIGLLEETNHIFGLADGTKSYPVGIVKDVEVHIGKLKLLNDFYVIDMKKDPETPLLVGRGFLATANAVIDCRKAKIADFLDYHLAGEWEIARHAKINPFKDVLVFTYGRIPTAMPINLKGNMWESEDLIENPINWDKSAKDGDGAWHAKIRIIDPDGEEFIKTLQSTPPLESSPKEKVQRRSSTWTASMTLDV
ncbi:MAK10-like protein [Tanacetum coccineum]